MVLLAESMLIVVIAAPCEKTENRANRRDEMVNFFIYGGFSQVFWQN